MLNPVSPTLLVTETPAMWSCVPAPAYARWLLRWGVGFTVFLGVAFPAGVWLMFGATLLVGFGVALMVGGWLLVGVLGYAVHRLWRDRATPLVADAERVTLSYGPALLCRLEEVREIAFQEDPSGDDVSYSLVAFSDVWPVDPAAGVVYRPVGQRGPGGMSVLRPVRGASTVGRAARGGSCLTHAISPQPERDVVDAEPVAAPDAGRKAGRRR